MKLPETILLTFLCLLNYSTGYAQDKELHSTILNKTLACKIGEPAIISEEVIKDVQVRITESFEVKSGFTRYTHQEEDMYPLRRTKKGYHLYYSQQKLIDGKYWGIGISEDDVNDVIPVLVRPNGDIERMKKYKIHDKIEFIDTYLSCSDCSHKELVFMGLESEKIKFNYRELHGILNKVLLEKEVFLQMDKDQTVAHNGAKLKIISVDQDSLKYEVLSGFDSQK